MNTHLSHPRWLPVFAGTAVGLALGGMLVVQMRTGMRESRYDLAALEDRTAELQDQLERLRRERQRLASPGRVRRLAELQGMIDPPADAFLKPGSAPEVVAWTRTGEPTP